MTGDSVNGIPELACDATPASPAGRYTISISQGTILNDAVYLTHGYLNVLKVDAKATIGDYTRQQGEPDPQFGIIRYEGLIEADSIPVWLSEPVFTTSATLQSPPGEYPITVESADAQSYNMTFIEGTLTITPSTAVTSATQGADNPPVIYTIDGKPGDNTSEKGLFIIDGKKTIMR